MGLVDTYEKIKPSIVAFTEKYSILTDAELQNERNVSFPPIHGTGFIVDENGVVATNNHVAEILSNSQYSLLTQNGECLYFATLFKITDEGLVQMPLDILKVYQPKSYPGKMYYGPDKPDIAFVLVKAKNLPALELENSILKEGIEVATAGYPMGTDALTAPGYLHQITPTLQKGIISAVLPFQQELPHAYALNIMVQGGASGSPVFLPESGNVVGIVNSSLREFNQGPTNISYAIPSCYISAFLGEVKTSGGFELPKNTKALDELISSKKLETILPGQHPCTVIKIDNQQK